VKSLLARFRRMAASPRPSPGRGEGARRRWHFLPLSWRDKGRATGVAVAGAVLALSAAGAALWKAERSGALAAVGHWVGERAATAGGTLGLLVRKVEVEGRDRTEREAILAALGVKHNSPILAVDPAAAKARLEALPWVRSAAVERRLPDTIHVRIVERVPLAIWQNHRQRRLIDRDGAVVRLDDLGPFAGLILLVGEDAPEHGAGLVDLLASEQALADRVIAAVRYGGRRWNLEFDNKVEVALPERDPAVAWHRLARLERDDHLLERDIEAVDLRLPDRLVVRTVPEPPKPPPAKHGKGGKRA
jgi:cell division protein FtsQ